MTTSTSCTARVAAQLREAAQDAARIAETRNRDLACLDDPELIKQWARARSSLALTPPDSPQHTQARQAYDSALAEYRRRVDGQPA